MNRQSFQGIFLGFLVATLLSVLAPHPVHTQVGIQYINHAHEPHVWLGVREPDSQYTYLIHLQLVNYPADDDYAQALVLKRELTDLEWIEWSTEDTNPWKPYPVKRGLR